MTHSYLIWQYDPCWEVICLKWHWYSLSFLFIHSFCLFHSFIYMLWQKTIIKVDKKYIIYTVLFIYFFIHFFHFVRHKCLHSLSPSFCCSSIVWSRRGGEDGPQTCGDISGQHTETLRSRKHGQHCFLTLYPHTHTHTRALGECTVAVTRHENIQCAWVPLKHTKTKIICDVHTVREVTIMLTSRQQL